jgi:phage-related holin
MNLWLVKKATAFFLLVSLVICQRLLHLSGIDILAGTGFTSIFSIKETGSVIENCIKMGITIPEPIIKWFKVYPY